MHLQESGAGRPVLREGSPEVRELFGCAPLQGQEQLPLWHKAVFAGEPRGLEDFHHVGNTVARPPLDH